MIMKGLKSKIRELLSAEAGGQTLIFLGQTACLAELDDILSHLDGCLNSVFRLVSFDVELTGLFEGLDTVYAHDYLGREDCAQIDDFLFRGLGRSWYLDKAFSGGNFSLDELKVLGRCAEYNYYGDDFIFPLKYAEAMRRIFSDRKPERVIIIEDRTLLYDIASIFAKDYGCRVIRVRPSAYFMLVGLIKRAANLFKAALVDLGIIFLDGFVRLIVISSRRFEGRVIVDHRLYGDFCNGRLEKRILICPFEKGLKLRLKLVAKGLFYLPMRPPLLFERFLHAGTSFRLVAEWRRCGRKNDFQDIFRHRGVPLWRVFKKYFGRLFSVVFPRVRDNIAYFRRFALKRHPRLVIMRSDLKELERSIVEACGQANIPSLVVQLGVIGNRNMSDTLLADMTAVWGQATREWFRQFGYPQNRFRVTGNPSYDQLYQRIASGRQQERRRTVLESLKLDPGLKTIVFLTASNYLHGTSFAIVDEMTIILREALKALKSLATVQLVVKLHPYDPRLLLYRKIIEKNGLAGRAVAVKDCNTYEIIEASDAAIMRCSSTGLASLILGKPLISVMLFKGEFLNVPYAEEGAAIGVKDAGQIAKAIGDALFDQETRRRLERGRANFIFNYAYKIDGRATRRVEELADALMNKRDEFHAQENR